MVTDFLRGVNLYLIGMMGAGKSTVGQALAQELDYRFLDTDTLIEQLTGQTISQIFAESGEAEFRQIETQVLAEVSAYTRLVAATGGGIVLRQANWSYLHHGLTVWLDVPVEILLARLQGDSSRPLLQEPDPAAKLQTLLAQRLALYQQADVHIRCDRPESPTQLAQRILAEIRPVLRTTVPAADSHLVDHNLN
jgi:shikimate kinase